MRRRCLKLFVTFGIMMFALTEGAGRAEAFYWPPWPGVDGGVPTTRPELPPTTQSNPPITIPPIIIASTPEPNPPTVPEPAALLSAVIGLGAVAGYRKWKARGDRAA